MTESKLPEDWDEARVKGIIQHYERQLGEDPTEEPSYTATTSTWMDVPVDLVPRVRALIAKRTAS